jgi:hypothetical protein
MPAIQHEIHRENWRLDLDRGQQAIPPLPRLFERTFNVIRITVLRNQTPGVFGIIRLPENINQRLFFPGTEFEFRLQCPAGIEPGTHAPAKRLPLQSRWGFHRAIAPQEYRAITGV